MTDSKAKCMVMALTEQGRKLAGGSNSRDLVLDIEVEVGGTWVVQWVKASAFGSGHDGSSPASGSLLSREPASSSLSLCLPLCLLAISVK